MSLRMETYGSSFGPGNIPLDFIKGFEFLEEPNNYKLLQKGLKLLRCPILRNLVKFSDLPKMQCTCI
jgi:hypothetical protein